MMDNFISFNDNEIPSNKHGSAKALHITTKVKDCTLPIVLIDNGSSLHVILMCTLMRLHVDASFMKHNRIMVKRFDGTKRKVIGEIELAIQIGTYTFMWNSRSWINCRPITI